MGYAYHACDPMSALSKSTDKIPRPSNDRYGPKSPPNSDFLVAGTLVPPRTFVVVSIDLEKGFVANDQLPFPPMMLLIAVLLQMYLVTKMAVGKWLGGDWLLSSREESANYGNSTGARFGRARNKGFKAIIQF